jgi:hypothetical protein
VGSRVGKSKLGVELKLGCRTLGPLSCDCVAQPARDKAEAEEQRPNKAPMGRVSCRDDNDVVGCCGWVQDFQGPVVGRAAGLGSKACFASALSVV